VLFNNRDDHPKNFSSGSIAIGPGSLHQAAVSTQLKTSAIRPANAAAHCARVAANARLLA
jgi:hypothetical protein